MAVPLALAPAGAEEQAPAHLAFAVYAAGFNVLNIDSDLDLGGPGYRIDLSYRTAGLFGTLFRSEINSFVQGFWADSRPEPLRFASWGVLRGNTRRTTIDYQAHQPVIRALEPAQEADRDPVPPAMQHDTIDTLSAMALLVRQVASTGRCDGRVATFDGRRASEITARTGGEEELRADYHSSFHGRALRCDIEGRQIGGFQHDTDEAELHKIHYSTAWLARVVPGAPALPVRVVFETRFFGHATAYLTEARPGHATASATGAAR
ncbi:DUF3108 domain-containing protein [Limobrevibacterium gyesilva]|nr:DUF3108 domain-containing protein [Limobrevibacterium gyesilva]